MTATCIPSSTATALFSMQRPESSHPCGSHARKTTLPRASCYIISRHHATVHGTATYTAWTTAQSNNVTNSRCPEGHLRTCRQQDEGQHDEPRISLPPRARLSVELHRRESSPATYLLGTLVPLFTHTRGINSSRVKGTIWSGRQPSSDMR